MVIWGLRIVTWVLGSPWTAGIALAALAAVSGWHVLTERAQRLHQIEQAVAVEKLAWHESMQKERDRQAAVSKQARDDAEREIARLEAENAALAALSRDLDNEADKEATAGDRCLSDDGVLRLNRQR